MLACWGLRYHMALLGGCGQRGFRSFGNLFYGKISNLESVVESSLHAMNGPWDVSTWKGKFENFAGSEDMTKLSAADMLNHVAGSVMFFLCLERSQKALSLVARKANNFIVSCGSGAGLFFWTSVPLLASFWRDEPTVVRSLTDLAKFHPKKKPWSGVCT